MAVVGDWAKAPAKPKNKGAKLSPTYQTAVTNARAKIKSNIATGRSTGLGYAAAQAWNDHLAAMNAQQAPAPAPYRAPASGGSSGGGGGRGYGGGGGGGGGGNGAALAQSQLEALMQLIGSKSYTFAGSGADQALTAQETGVRTASAQDLGAAKTAYGDLDKYLLANQSNPYENLQFAQAPTSPDYNPYLQTQGVQPLNNVQQNPDDAYGGFQNAGKLLGANTIVNNTSQRTGSQQGLASAVADIGGQENAFLNQINGQRASAQATLDAEKRQAILQLLPLIGAGAKAPADLLARLGLA